MEGAECEPEWEEVREREEVKVDAWKESIEGVVCEGPREWEEEEEGGRTEGEVGE